MSIQRDSAVEPKSRRVAFSVNRMSAARQEEPFSNPGDFFDELFGRFRQ
jgi:hypothetical protein